MRFLAARCGRAAAVLCTGKQPEHFQGGGGIGIDWAEKTKEAKLSDQLARAKNEILSAVYSCFALEALMIPPLFIADESSSADLLREMSLSEKAEYFADLGHLMVKTNGNFPAAYAASAEARSLACAHDLAFANNGFASRDDFIDFYRTAAARSETRVENRRKSRERG